jgi:hypothetical protein
MTFFQPPNRGPKWTLVNGVWETEKSFNDTDVDTQDFSDRLKGETIASIAVTSDGISLLSSSNTSTTTTVTVSGQGALHIDITTSGGRTFREYFLWRRTQVPTINLGGSQTLGEDYGP